LKKALWDLESPGETYDFDFLPVGLGPLLLEVELQRAAGQRASISLGIAQ
jgi:hypothetical protein